MVTVFWFTKHNKDKMLILLHREMNVIYVWLVSSKYVYRLQSNGKSPITSGSPLVHVILKYLTDPEKEIRCVFDDYLKIFFVKSS